MTDDENEERAKALIEQGMLAHDLLEHPAFLSTVNRLMETYSVALFNTAPHEQKTREMYYTNAMALQSLVDMLRQDVLVANEVIENARD